MKIGPSGSGKYVLFLKIISYYIIYIKTGIYKKNKP